MRSVREGIVRSVLRMRQLRNCLTVARIAAAMAFASDQSREQWLAKREARRAKQREQNVGRARKMHEARLCAGGDLAQQLFAAPTNASLPPVLIGCSGWYYWHWRECF